MRQHAAGPVEPAPGTGQQELSPSTFGNEERLPRVPIPALEDSCDRFLQWCGPLLTADELSRTEAAVAAFRAADGPGPALHAALQAYEAADGVHSWLDAFWRDRYLGRRDRIALNANFFFLFNEAAPAPRDPAQAQVERAAALVAGAVAYKLLIDTERLPPVVQRGRPLSMEQNRYLFSTTRIPGALLDGVRTPYSDDHPGPSRERHVVVWCRGSAYRLDVLGPTGRPYPVEELAAGIRGLLETAPRAAPDTSVGHLTTLPRAAWATARSRLLDAHPDNAVALDTVESALFGLCLEDAVPADPLAACDQLLHGDGGNRWFDTAVSFVVFADGTAGYNGEHSRLDGTTVIGLLDAVLESSGEEHSRRSGAQPQGTPPSAPVPFVLDAGLRADVRAADEAFRACAAATATTTVSIEVGSDRVKALGVSPDAFVQLAFQLAHRRAKGMVGATYESIATRQYHHGRTEAMRVVTPEVLRFVAAMEDASVALPARRDALRAAADAHVERARQCQAGLAPEQHLWELQLLARRSGAELSGPLALYGTPGWTTMRDDYLSTSSVPSANVPFWGFGSTSQRCIGVAYALLPDRFNLYLSTPSAVRGQMTDFARRLPEAVLEMAALLQPRDGAA